MKLYARTTGQFRADAGMHRIAIARGEMDDEALSEMARRYGLDAIGPVPAGSVWWRSAEKESGAVGG